MRGTVVKNFRALFVDTIGRPPETSIRALGVGRIYINEMRRFRRALLRGVPIDVCRRALLSTRRAE